MITAYVGHYACSQHDTGWQHPDHQGRLAAVSRAVYRDMLTLHDVLRDVEGAPADEVALELAHAPEYIREVRDAADAAGEAGQAMAFGAAGRISGASWDAALAAAGCGVTAVDTVLDSDSGRAFCAIRPPGGQVGVATQGGYGIFNSVAIAALHAREVRGLSRVLVVEWGDAAGTGTAEIVRGHEGVRLASVHRTGQPLHPGDNIFAAPVEPGAKVDEVWAALDRVLRDATAEFAPELVVLGLGLDALETDPVGKLALQPIDTYILTRLVTDTADESADGRVVSLLEGGYDASATGKGVVQHLRAMTGLAPDAPQRMS